jgi:hypothetical protein
MGRDFVRSLRERTGKRFDVTGIPVALAAVFDELFSHNKIDVNSFYLKETVEKLRGSLLNLTEMQEWLETYKCDDDPYPEKKPDFKVDTFWGRLELAQEMSSRFSEDWHFLGDSSEPLSNRFETWLYLVKSVIVLAFGLGYYDYGGNYVQDNEIAIFSFNGESFSGLDGTLQNWDELIIPLHPLEWRYRIIHDFC